MRTFPILVIVLSLASAAGLGLTFHHGRAAPMGPPGNNDAGSGMDAGDTPDAALLVAGGRRIWGANLTPPGQDADWYRRAASGSFCALVDATVNSPGFLTLTSSTDRTTSASREALPHRQMRLSLAAPAGSSPFFGVEPPLMNTLSAGGGAPGPGHYTFAFSTATFAELDPEGDGEVPDAGSTPATSAALPSGCAAGRLGSGDADVEDRYHFDVGQAREITVSFAIASGAAAQLRVLTPSGALYGTAASGGAVDVWASETGRWTVVVAPVTGTPSFALSPLLGVDLAPRSANGWGTDYILGTTDGPDPEPCRPSCA